MTKEKLPTIITGELEFEHILEYYTHRFWCDNCEDENVIHILKGKRLKGLKCKCENCSVENTLS